MLGTSAGVFGNHIKIKIEFNWTYKSQRIKICVEQSTNSLMSKICISLRMWKAEMDRQQIIITHLWIPCAEFCCWEKIRCRCLGPISTWFPSPGNWSSSGMSYTGILPRFDACFFAGTLTNNTSSQLNVWKTNEQLYYSKSKQTTYFVSLTKTIPQVYMWSETGKTICRNNNNNKM